MTIWLLKKVGPNCLDGIYIGQKRTPSSSVGKIGDLGNMQNLQGTLASFSGF